jgi:hypothetical protein
MDLDYVSLSAKISIFVRTTVSLIKTSRRHCDLSRIIAKQKAKQDCRSGSWFPKRQHRVRSKAPQEPAPDASDAPTEPIMYNLLLPGLKAL